VDGNTLLDLCSTESLPLGHNSDALLKSVSQKKWDQHVINSAVDAGQVVLAGLPERVNKVFGSVAPKGLPGVNLTGGKNATEHAIMDAMRVRG